MARLDHRDSTGYGWSAWVGILVFMFIIVGIFMLASGDNGDQQVSMRDDAPTTQAPAPSGGAAPPTQNQ